VALDRRIHAAHEETHHLITGASNPPVLGLVVGVVLVKRITEEPSVVQVSFYWLTEKCRIGGEPAHSVAVARLIGADRQHAHGHEASRLPERSKTIVFAGADTAHALPLRAGSTDTASADGYGWRTGNAHAAGASRWIGVFLG
jgi:hypothetical protein